MRAAATRSAARGWRSSALERRALADARARRRRRRGAARRERARRGSRASSPSGWTARYEPGRRRSDWIKVKNKQREDVHDRRLAAGRGAAARRASARCSSASARRRRLRYAGRVGTASTRPSSTGSPSCSAPIERRRRRRSRRRRRAPKAAIWVEPRLRRARSSSPSGRSDGILRHPSYKGLREAAAEALRRGRVAAARGDRRGPRSSSSRTSTRSSIRRPASPRATSSTTTGGSRRCCCRTSRAGR